MGQGKIVLGFFIAFVGILIGVKVFKTPTQNHAAQNHTNDLDQAERSLAQANSMESLNKIILGMGSSDLNVSDQQNLKTAIEKLAELKIAVSSIKEDSPEILYKDFYEILSSLRGFTWRIAPLMQEFDVAFLASLKHLRDFKRNRDRRGGHWDGIFEYITTPISDKEAQIKTFSEFQTWLNANLTGKFETLAKHLETLARANKSFSINTDLYFGLMQNEGAPSNLKQALVEPAHLFAAASHIKRALGIAYYLGAYDLDKTPQFYRELLRKNAIGMNSEFAGKIIKNYSIQTPLEISNIMRGKSDSNIGKAVENAMGNLHHPYKGWLVVKNSALLAKSLKSFQEGAFLGRDAFMAMTKLAQNKNSASVYIVSPEMYINRPGESEEVWNKRIEMLNGETNLNDPINGKTLGKIDVTKIFKSDKAHDLKNLYAIDFSKEAASRKVTGKIVDWNYDYGRAIAWNPDVMFAGIFGEDTNNNNVREKINAVLRDKSMRWLGIWLNLFQ